MKLFLDALDQVLKQGTTRGDRTGTGTISLFGMQQRYNLAESFPAVTTKKLAFKACVGELLWMIEGSGDERRLAEITYGDKEGAVTIWTPNALAPYWKPKAKFEGDLQKVYGYQWRKWGVYDKWESSVTLIKQGAEVGNDTPFSKRIPLEQPTFANADDLVGNTYPTTKCGDIKVLCKLDTRNGNTYYRVQFLNGINTIVECSRPNIRSGTVKNPYAMTAANGNGCYGIITKRSSYITKAYNMWLNMMERCHGIHPTKTIYYKEQGIFVNSEWRCFSNFYKDIHGLVGFDQWSNNPSKFDLDKDYGGNNFYGRTTAIFLPSWYNMHILPNKVTDGKLYTATNKQTGEIFKFTSPALFNRHTKTSGLVDRAFLNQNGQTRIWKFTREEAPIGYKWRQQFFIDQLKSLIEGIKTDPHGRRHILTAWNPGELQAMALPPCHCFAQFYVADGKLSCQMYQRSCDMFLGVPFNIASYSLLTHMIAQVCGLKVGEFIHALGDAHIYLNHIDQVKEQLTRAPLPAPQLWLNPDITDITKFTMDDIRLDGYTSHSPIKAVMAV